MPADFIYLLLHVSTLFWVSVILFLFLFRSFSYLSQPVAASCTDRLNFRYYKFETEVMAGESKKDHKDIGEIAGDVPTTSTEEKKRKKKRGVMSQIWNGLFRLHGDDFEKRLQYISKEEATVLARMKKRSSSWRRMTRLLIIFSVLFEVTAVGYAIMTTRSLDLNWQKRALRVLPIFLLPALSSLTYSAFLSFTKMWDRKDQKTLERLRTERREKINELKEKTNYYSTQQLIQRYDPDPAAKAAAATVLASKLGADSGLKVFMGDDSKFNPPTGKSNEAEFVQSSGLRKRKQSNTRSSSTESAVLHHSEEEMMQYAEPEGLEMSKHDQLVVEHQNPMGLHSQDGGWIARIAAFLVGEDPTQSYALICGNCHMHNGLARKEDFLYITYYCPHCNALNRPKQVEGHASDSSSPNMSASLVSSPNVGASMVSSPNVGASMVSSPNVGASMVNSPVVGPATPVDDASTVLNTSGSMSDDKASNSSSPVAAAVEHKEGSETILSESSVS